MKHFLILPTIILIVSCGAKTNRSTPENVSQSQVSNVTYKNTICGTISYLNGNASFNQGFFISKDDIRYGLRSVTDPVRSALGRLSPGQSVQGCVATNQEIEQGYEGEIFPVESVDMNLQNL